MSQLPPPDHFDRPEPGLSASTGGPAAEAIGPAPEGPPAARGPGAENANRHWRAWEIEALLDILDRNGSLQDVAARLGRTVDGVRREYERLLAGQTPCPVDYQGYLLRLRGKAVKHKPAPARAPQPRTAGGKAGQAAEQYRSLAQHISRVEAVALDLRAESLVRLALAVADGRLPAALLAGLVSPRGCTAVARLARDLRAGGRPGNRTVGGDGPSEGPRADRLAGAASVTIPSDSEMVEMAQALSVPDPFDQW